MRDGQIEALVKAHLKPTNQVVLDLDMRSRVIAKMLTRPRLRICGITLIGPLMTEQELAQEYMSVAQEDAARRRVRAEHAAKAKDAEMVGIQVGVNGGPKP